MKLSICRDPADNMLLECCFESKADILISSDRDLLDIRVLPFHLKILTPILAGLSRHQTGDVAPQGRYSETTVFARGAPQLVNFLEKNNPFLTIA